MTVPLDVRNNMHSMDVEDAQRAEIARRLHLNRSIVAKYADMEGLSLEPSLPEKQPRPALKRSATWIDAVQEADLSAQRKQYHMAKRLFDRLVDERGYEVRRT